MINVSSRKRLGSLLTELSQAGDSPGNRAAVRRPLDCGSDGQARRAPHWPPQVANRDPRLSYAWFAASSRSTRRPVWVGYDRTDHSEKGGIPGTLRPGIRGCAAPIWAVHEIVSTWSSPCRSPTDRELAPYVVPPTTTVPNLIGIAEGDAIARLTEAKLEARVRPIPSLQPAGTVVFQSVGGGRVIEIGFPITIYVSTGQQPAGAMPAVAGLTLRSSTPQPIHYTPGGGRRLCDLCARTDESQRNIVLASLRLRARPCYKDSVS